MKTYSEEELEKFSFNKLCRMIKKNKGLVGENLIDRAFFKAYEASSMIALSNAKKKGIMLKSIDVENFGAEVYIALKKSFNAEKVPYDLNRYVNAIISNKLADLVKKRIKEKETQEYIKFRESNEMTFRENSNYSLNEKIIITKEALKSISEKCRNVLFLVAQRYKTSEIIKELGLEISETAMRQRLRECRKQLGRIAGGFGDEE